MDCIIRLWLIMKYNNGLYNKIMIIMNNGLWLIIIIMNYNGLYNKIMINNEI